MRKLHCFNCDCEEVECRLWHNLWRFECSNCGSTILILPEQLKEEGYQIINKNGLVLVEVK